MFPSDVGFWSTSIDAFFLSITEYLSDLDMSEKYYSLKETLNIIYVFVCWFVVVFFYLFLFFIVFLFF
jgi:hypothetical protein